jgi:hypothetical protein
MDGLDVIVESTSMMRDSEAGHVLARINRQEPAQRTRLARLVNDVLLAMCARQIGATLCSLNREDFTLIARYRTCSFVLL